MKAVDKELQEKLLSQLNDRLREEKLKFDIGAMSIVEADDFLSLTRNLLKQMDISKSVVVEYSMLQARMRLNRFQAAFNAACEEVRHA